MITYVKGDALKQPAPLPEPRIVAHVCNNIGAWGAGFTNALDNKWEEPWNAYRDRRHYSTYNLGTIELIRVGTDLYVANMIAQQGVRGPGNPVPLDYVALTECLTKVNSIAYALGATIHMPRIGCGLAGGKWGIVEKIIEASVGVPVFVYDLEIT